jgi:NADPH:quinone reductase-like Zn-dependent oxidoreductase
MSEIVVATAYGGPEVLALDDTPAPDPGPGEVRIAVHAAGVNPVDYKLYGGAFGSLATLQASEPSSPTGTTE